ncbi:transmembrane protein 200B [Hippocampus comes]|uniref:Transmembrane protein 200B n=1 Tax=Hippocampus comes TaxID=109280 RepID=A0A3Q3DPX1_HIPCM|nr:PREDICTED: transmembrane protein 200B-like [Hippocampus comes]
MKTLNARGATSLSPSRRRRPRFTLRARKKKDGAIRGKLRLRSLAGAFLALGVIVVTLGAALAVAGYRMSRWSIAGAAEGNGVPEPAGNRSRGAQGFLSSVSERMKLLGPVIMGVGLFILICANTVLYENRDRETQVLLAQMRSVICSVSAAVPSADLREMAVANFVSKHHWVSTLPAAQLNSFDRRRPASSEPPRRTRPVDHRREDSAPPARGDAPSRESSQVDFRAAFETEPSLNARPDTSLAKLNRHPMSAGSMSTLGADDVDIPAAWRPRRCHSMSYRTKADEAQSAFASAGEEDHSDQPLTRREPLSRVSIDIAGQVADASEERARQSWPRLDLAGGRRYLKLENKEDSVDKLLERLERRCSRWEKSFGSGPFQ